MSPDTVPIVRSIRRTLRGLVVATVLLWLVVFIGGGLVVAKVSRTADTAHTTADIARRNSIATSELAAANRATEETTHAALCAFHADLGKRIKQTRDYLAKNPQPLILGVPRATFEKSLADEQRTYDTLQGLNC